MCKKLIKNSPQFGKKIQKTVGGIFFDSHCTINVLVIVDKDDDDEILLKIYYN